MTAVDTRAAGESEADAAPIFVSWARSPDGSFVACLRVGTAAVDLVVTATRTGRKSTYRPDGLDQAAQAAPLDDGRVLCVHHSQGVHHLDLIDVNGLTCRLHTSSAQGFRVLPLRSSTALAVAVEVDVPVTGRSDNDLRAAFTSTVTLVTPEGGCRSVTTVPGLLTGGVQLPDGRLGMNVRLDSAGGGDAVAIDLSTGRAEPLLSVRATTIDAVVAVDHVTGLVVVMTDAGGRDRVGYAEPGRPWRFPTGFDAPSGTLQVLGAGGSLVLVAVVSGLRTRLLVADCTTDQVREVAVPLGAAWGPAVVRQRSAQLPWSTPTSPAVFLSVDFDPVPITTRSGRARSLSEPRVEEVPGAAGDLEALVLGDPDEADLLVLALHGGPLDHWRAGYDPLLQALSDAGAAVVALNQRGSTGYGQQHVEPLLGAWGGPDLADVLAVGDHLLARRQPGSRPAALVGSSYGAWLGLLAAADDGQRSRSSTALPRFSTCVALAAFSGPLRLRAEIDGPVADLMDRLGAGHPPAVGEAHRDVSDRARDIAIPVLQVHGLRDDVVPVEHARSLATALARHADARYLELPQAGHELIGSPHRAAVLRPVLRFLTGRPPDLTAWRRSTGRR